MRLEDEIEKLEAERKKTRFAYLARVCQEHFGNPRIRGSHHIFKTPWPGDPRINLQVEKGYAKPYQVDQVVEALRRLQQMQENKKEAAKARGGK
ncbi:MAG TPA: hypothetical protein VF546_02415 [Pyrinomonadaceae bacterium]|jgi:hypothetical protein